jgi:hypothetical protein
MIQIVIWGMAAMLVVKALDILHQQSIAGASGNAGSFLLSTGAAVLAILSALGLIWLASQQVNSSDSLRTSALGLSGSASTMSELSAAEAMEGTSGNAMEEIAAIANELEATADNATNAALAK